MKKYTCQKKYIVLVLMPLLFLMELNHLFAQETGFTYQGLLTENGAPANGIYDLRFRLFDALVNGDQVANTITRTPVTVKDGPCNDVDFGDFRWEASRLEIGIRASGSTRPHSANAAPGIVTGPALHAAFAGGLSGSDRDGHDDLHPRFGRLSRRQREQSGKAQRICWTADSPPLPALHPPHDRPKWLEAPWQQRDERGVNFPDA